MWNLYSGVTKSVCASLCMFHVTHCSLIHLLYPWPTCEKVANAANVSVRLATPTPRVLYFCCVPTLVADTVNAINLIWTIKLYKINCVNPTAFTVHFMWWLFCFFNQKCDVSMHMTCRSHIQCWNIVWLCACIFLCTLHIIVTCHCRAALASNYCRRHPECQVISSNSFYS